MLNVVREAVSNALRHAQARQIDVRLERVCSDRKEAPEHWRLDVADDGCGFDMTRVNGHGRGLKNLAARASELGGRSAIQSAPGSGTRVTVEFPC